MCTFNDPLNDVMACDCHGAFHFRCIPSRRSHVLVIRFCQWIGQFGTNSINNSTSMVLKAFFLVILAVCTAHRHIPVHFQPLSEDIIDYINSLDTTWKAGKNFEGATVPYVKGLLGTILNDPNEEKLAGLLSQARFYTMNLY